VREDRFYLIHMAECIANINEDTAGGRAVFLSNRTIRDAVMHNLRLLAESSKRVSDAEKARLPAIPWRDLADFRNVIVHDYLKIDLDEIWSIVENNLPPLKDELTRLLAQSRPHS
jgi:uncharacterized protein with HEPN domain